QTGDIRVLLRHYPHMKKWMQYMPSRYMDKDGIITKDSYGDWCFPPATIEEGRGKIADKKYPSALISSAYYYHLSNMMTRFSVLTGNEQDSAYFADLAVKMRQSFNKRFYNEKGFYGANKLTDNLLAMYFGLVEDQNKEKLANRIVEIIEKENNGHLSTGVIGTQWIMRTLTDMGRVDLAYKIATNKTYPSWGYMIENGATTIWELWNGNTAHPKMNSQNHVMMLGDLMIWYYENLAGIKSKENAFQTIVMRPEMIDGLNHVNASYNGLYGNIESNWTKSKSAFEWRISVPANSKAQVYIPAKDALSLTEAKRSLKGNKDVRILEEKEGRVLVEVGSGNYHFKSKL
ncbi:alpha-rhamnosidase, partial [Pseudoxanthomonas sp. SGD-10]